jgi:hypothetical protein
MTLAHGGKSAYVIVVSDQASPPERTAAQRLRFYLKEVTGADLPILAAPRATGPSLWVGQSPTVRALLPGVNWDALGTEGIIIKTVGDDLVLAGGQPRGALYAVYSFLEDNVGCRWWSSTESTLPKRHRLRIGRLDRTYVPPVLIRDILYRDVYKSPEFQVQMKLNGQYNAIPAEYGGHLPFIPDIAHTFFKLLPPDRYFAEHPEWYSEVKGKRTASGEAQLCLSNEAMRREITRVLQERLRQDPSSRLVSLSQNDSFGGNCQCPPCRALDEQNGSPAGSLITFVNAVAADLEKEFPAVLVETLAYNYSRAVPTQVRPRQNVIVRLVGGIGCSYDQPLDSPVNPLFRDAAQGWSRIAPNLFFWDYVTNFSNYLVPHPNLQVLAPNIRFFVQCHAKGIFEQGDSGNLAGDFVRLRAWLLAHLLWNPEADQAALTREFLDGYYGAAAPAMARFLALVEASFLARDIRLSSSGSNLGYLDLDEMNAATRLWVRAEAAVAKDARLLLRVQRERLTFDHLWLLRYALLKQQATQQGKPFLGPSDPAAAAAAFVERLRLEEPSASGGMLNEGTSVAAYEARLNSLIRSLSVQALPPAECSTLPAAGWVDLQDCYFNQQGATTVDDPLASDQKASKVGGPWGITLPFSGELIQRWPGKWQIYVSIRVDAKPAEGIVLDYGVYDFLTKGEPIINVRADQIPDAQYHTYLAATTKLTYNQCLWVSRIQGDVLVDRVFLIPVPD